MKINKSGLELIKNFEGIRLAPYLDVVNIPTIGIGATSYQDGHRVVMTDKPITEQQAMDLLAFHIQKFEQEVSAMIKVPVNENQFSALVSFAYNVGSGNLSASTLLKKINVKDYTGASAEFLRWNKAGGKEVAGLTRPRKAEQDLFLKPLETAKPANLLPDGPSDADINSMLKDIETKIL